MLKSNHNNAAAGDQTGIVSGQHIGQSPAGTDKSCRVKRFFEQSQKQPEEVADEAAEKKAKLERVKRRRDAVLVGGRLG